MRRLRVLIVDDHAVLRQALRMRLDSHDELAVVGDVSNGREAARAAEELGPDVVLMDLIMPGLNGLDATRQIRKRCPNTRVLILSGYEDEEQIVEALRAGASGYLIKESEIGELMLAIQAVARGNHYFSSSLSQGDDPNDFVLRARSDVKSGYDRLTDREREVLQLDRRRPRQPHDRRAAGDQREDRRGAQGAHHEQTRRPQSHGSDPLCDPARDHQPRARRQALRERGLSREDRRRAL